MDILNAKEQVILAGRELAESGLIARTWGNVSCRTGKDEFVITASGRNYMTLTPEEIVTVKIKDMSHEGDVKPSSEKRIHREIYRLKKDAGFIIHTHQSNASAVSAMGLDKVKLNKNYDGIGFEVLCAGYGLPGTKKLSRNTAAAVKEAEGKAVIMSNHGAICYGHDYEEAFEIAHTLEDACGNYLKGLGIEPWNPDVTYYDGNLWNKSPVIVEFMNRNNVLKTYLDDFAQLVGVSLKVIEYDGEKIKKALNAGKPLLVRGKGALCAAADESDSEAISMVIEKNCRAALAAMGAEPINQFESFFMRQKYLKKYSKLSK